jgi:chaperonin GroES
MNIKPMGDRVLVKMEQIQEKTAGGIYIPQTAQEKTQIAEVLEIGSDETITVKKGDKVMYDKYAGTSVKANGEEFLILHMSDILAIID